MAKCFKINIATLPHFGNAFSETPIATLPLFFWKLHCHFASKVATLPCRPMLNLVRSVRIFSKKCDLFWSGSKIAQKYENVQDCLHLVVVFSVLIIKLKKSKMEVPHHSKLRAHVLPIVKPDFWKKTFGLKKWDLKLRFGFQLST